MPSHLHYPSTDNPCPRFQTLSLTQDVLFLQQGLPPPYSPSRYQHHFPLRNTLHTQFSLLHKYLCECPANTPKERGTQHQHEPLRVELCGLVGEHEEPPSDEQNHHQQCHPLDESKHKVTTDSWSSTETDTSFLSDSSTQLHSSSTYMFLVHVLPVSLRLTFSLPKALRGTLTTSSSLKSSEKSRMKRMAEDLVIV